MKVMLIGDVHLSDIPPSSCTASYTDDLFALIEAARDAAVARGCEFVIQAGDMFHIKQPSRTSHRLVQRAIEVWESFPMEVFCVPGNHDMTNNRFESVFSAQPLGVLLRSGAVNLLSGWMDSMSWKGQPIPQVESYDIGGDLPIYGIPWLAEWNHTDNSVRMAAVDEALHDFTTRWDGSVPALIVTHSPLYPPGLELSFEFYPTKQLSKQILSAVKGPVGLYYGHVHEAHGIYTSGGVRYANLGALSRGSIHEHNLKREISVTVWDSETNKFEVVPLPHKPASEVFRLQEVAEVKTAQMDLDNFLTSVDAASIEITSIESVVQHVRQMGLPADVVAMVEELLTSS